MINLSLQEPSGLFSRSSSPVKELSVQNAPKTKIPGSSVQIKSKSRESLKINKSDGSLSRGRQNSRTLTSKKGSKNSSRKSSRMSRGASKSSKGNSLNNSRSASLNSLKAYKKQPQSKNNSRSQSRQPVKRDASKSSIRDSSSGRPPTPHNIPKKDPEQSSALPDTTQNVTKQANASNAASNNQPDDKNTGTQPNPTEIINQNIPQANAHQSMYSPIVEPKKSTNTNSLKQLSSSSSSETVSSSSSGTDSNSSSGDSSSSSSASDSSSSSSAEELTSSEFQLKKETPIVKKESNKEPFITATETSHDTNLKSATPNSDKFAQLSPSQVQPIKQNHTSPILPPQPISKPNDDGVDDDALDQAVSNFWAEDDSDAESGSTEPEAEKDYWGDS